MYLEKPSKQSADSLSEAKVGAAGDAGEGGESAGWGGELHVADLGHSQQVYGEYLGSTMTSALFICVTIN